MQDSNQVQPGNGSVVPPVVPPSPQEPAVVSPSGGGSGKRFAIIGVVLILLLALGAGAYVLLGKKDTAKPKQTVKAAKVKVGFMMATTGGASSMGLGAIKGVDLAIKELGADNIEIVQADSKCDPKEVLGAVKKLIEQQVVAIIGEGCSSASVAALPEANKAKIPMISPSASSPALSIADDYFFRTIPPDDFQAAYLAKYVYNHGMKTVGLFYTNEPAGAGQARIFKEAYEKMGGKIVADTYADAHIIDVTSQAKTLKAANPDAIMLATNTVTSAIAMINLVREQGYTGKLVGTDANYDKTLISNTGKNSEGQIVSTFTLGTKAFKQSMSNEYQSAELAYAAPQAHDALHAILIATQKGANTGEKVKNALKDVDFQGVSGYRIKFDKNGEITGDVKYALLQVKDGDFVEIEQ